jgi:hypothetical protein
VLWFSCAHERICFQVFGSTNARFRNTRATLGGSCMCRALEIPSTFRSHVYRSRVGLKQQLPESTNCSYTTSTSRLFQILPPDIQGVAQLAAHSTNRPSYASHLHLLFHRYCCRLRTLLRPFLLLWTVFIYNKLIEKCRLASLIYRAIWKPCFTRVRKPPISSNLSRMERR